MAELLGRLNAKNANLGAFGLGKPEITQQDIAAALGMTKIPSGARTLIRVKWCDQREFFRETAIYLYERLAEKRDYSIIAKMRCHRPGLILDMSLMAVEEYCQSSVCKTCHGTRWAPNAQGVRSGCPSCRSCGIQPADRKALVVEFLDIHPATFYRSLADIYSDMQDILMGWESVALSALAARVRNNENNP